MKSIIRALSLSVLISTSIQAASAFEWVQYVAVGTAFGTTFNSVFGGWAYWKTRLQLKRNKDLIRKVDKNVDGVCLKVDEVRTGLTDFREQHQSDMAELHREHGAIHNDVRALREDVTGLRHDFNGFRDETRGHLNKISLDMNQGFETVEAMLVGLSHGQSPEKTREIVQTSQERRRTGIIHRNNNVTTGNGHLNGTGLHQLRRYDENIDNGLRHLG